MKTKIVVVILAVACAGLFIGLFAIKKQGEEQRASAQVSIADFSNQVVSANLKIIELNQANLTYSNEWILSRQQAEQLSNNLAEAAATIASSREALAGAQLQITNLNTHISDLETENRVLDQRAGELTNTIAQLNSLIDDTRGKLAASENNSQFLQQELQKQLAQKAEIEHKFNDLDALRQQVKKVKTDLFVARRQQLMRSDIGQKKGGQLLIEHATAAPPPPAPAGNYGLNVEVGSDGSVRVIPPSGAPTNAPAH
jgi:chromosome segregation ATPase